MKTMEQKVQTWLQMQSSLLGPVFFLSLDGSTVHGLPLFIVSTLFVPMVTV